MSGITQAHSAANLLNNFVRAVRGIENMNLRLVAKHLGIVSFLIAGTMLLSLPWAFPGLSGHPTFEAKAFWSIVISSLISAGVGAGLWELGRDSQEGMFRKEALAIVGLSWIIATGLGALPFLFAGTCIGSNGDGPGNGIPMSISEAIFESASGFTGTGATVIGDLENPEFVSPVILFWRSETHFLGGLGILVLFVAVLGQGASAKAVMRAELPGPMMQSQHARIQQTARNFAGIYVGLNAVLTACLLLQGMTLFDALCHSFGTIATGGFSTYNSSVAHFNSAAIEFTITFFMAVSCVNFALLNALLLVRPQVLLRDHEFQAYIGIIVIATLLVAGSGLLSSDFQSLWESLRYGTFHVVSILTNTGFGTHDFDRWNGTSRALLLILMFIGGCAGSTSCSIKVIRYLILAKALRIEIERAYRPNLVRFARIDGKPVDEAVVAHVVFYFTMVAVVCMTAWVALLALESPEKWVQQGFDRRQVMFDCFSAVAATFNGVGPGFGIVGPTRNFASLSDLSKLILTVLMLFGRLEILPVVVLFAPRFWKKF